MEIGELKLEISKIRSSIENKRYIVGISKKNGDFLTYYQYKKEIAKERAKLNEYQKELSKKSPKMDHWFERIKKYDEEVGRVFTSLWSDDVTTTRADNVVRSVTTTTVEDEDLPPSDRIRPAATRRARRGGIID